MENILQLGKFIIVRLALLNLLPWDFARWLINRGGMRDA